MTTRLLRSALILLGTLLLLAVGGGVAGGRTPPTSGVRPAAVRRPNIVLFMTDDQNVGDLRWMPKTRRLLAANGLKFTDALSPAPLCCPARAMTVTGQYGQNNGVQFNIGPFGGFAALRDKANTLAAWLQAVGYRTAHVGKYLNGYQGSNTPPQAGWTRWNPSVTRIYNYSNTGFLTSSGINTVPGNTTSAISGIAENDIRVFSAKGGPFFLWIAQLPPHASFGPHGWAPPVPTAKHAHVLGDVVLPSLSKPSFNAGGTGTPYPAKPPVAPERVQAEFTGRLRSLQDVDDGLARLIRVLQDTGELSHTYVFFVSDNGLLLGEHRVFDKNTLFHEDLRVPLIVRGPGVPAGAISTVPVTIVDLAPTILDLAGAQAGRLPDGQSFAPLLAGRPVSWRDTQLIQAGNVVTDSPQPGWAFRGVWTDTYTYMHRVTDGAEFLYDRRADPYELDNLASSPQYEPILEQLRSRYLALIGCAGASCSQQFGPLPPPLTTTPPARSR
jgi:N-acetylglucosamine-6-sulfatase